MLRIEPPRRLDQGLQSGLGRMTKPVTFRQSDIERAVKGVTAAGLPVARVEVVDGKIVVIVGNENEPKAKRNPLDRLHAA